jgi:large subunit ribosomal protein L13
VKTYAPRARDIERRWYVIDADGAILGRLASEVAKLLRGKHKPIFAPHADTGDHVIVINARGVRLSGSKLEGKLYQHHSGYPGGLKSVSYDRLMSERPTMVVEKAVRGMLPKNRLGRKMIGKLSVYEGAEHPHAAQSPVPLGLGEIPAWTGLPAPPEPKPAPEPKAAPEPTSRTRSTRAPRAGSASGAKEAAGAKRSTRAPRAKAADAPKSGATRRSGTASRGKKEPAAAAKKEPGGAAKPKTAATRSRAKATKDDKKDDKES